MFVKSKFEELLLKNWTSIIDHKQLTLLVLKTAQQTKFPIIETNIIRQKSLGLKLSRFEPIKYGFAVWVEFSIPSDDMTIIGTSEFHISTLGKIKHIQTTGNKFKEI